MKKSVFSFFNAVLISVFFFISCASAPKAEEQLPEEVLEDVNTVEDVIEEVTTVDNSSALEQADLARQAAIDANADKVAPIQFAATDALLKTLQAQAETGVDVSIGLKDVQTRYEALEKYAKAMDAKARVDELGFASYDQATYDKGNQAIADLQNLFSETNILSSAMLEKANEAYSSFNSVLIGAFKKLAKEERNGAFAAKRDADSVKAAVAEKAAYGKAVEDFKKGDSNYAMQNPEAALKNYQSAKGQFEVLFKTVSEKREAAQKAMEAAKNAVLETQNYAATADKEAPLTGEEVQGIEAEDAVLLEAETFADPKAAEVELSETISEEPIVEETSVSEEVATEVTTTEVETTTEEITVTEEVTTTETTTVTEETTVSEVETTSENTVVVTDEPEVTEVENSENLAGEKEAE
ncbi:MAG: hypothetical protein II223_00945 [Treponema sp.]|nr:hypothetical protein [Treponema sp.]